MKKFKFAFTLAEMLIALAIVGVVSAITIPQLVIKMQKKQAGLNVSSSVKQIELGCQQFLQAKNAELENGAVYTTIAQVEGFDSDEFARYLGFVPSEEDYSNIEFYYYSNLQNVSFMPAAYAEVSNASLGAPTTNTTTTTTTKEELELKHNKFGEDEYVYTPPSHDPVYVTPVDPEEEQDDSEGHYKQTEVKPGTSIKVDLGATKKEDNTNEDNTNENNTNENNTNENNTNEDNTNDDKKNEETPVAKKSVYHSQNKNGDVVFLGDFNLEVTKADDVIVNLVIDANGVSKKPNMYGKDIFEFELTNSGKLVPAGRETYRTECADGKITNGRACAARVVADGFKINY